MLFLNINSDPGATSKQKSFANDILRNDFNPGVTDRGGSAGTQRKFQLYEEQCLKATLGASAKAQANRHLSAGSYATSGAGSVASSNTRKSADKKQNRIGAGQQQKPTGQKQPKSALKTDGSSLKSKSRDNKELPKVKKQTRFETDANSDSE